jgi:hypothetical protein
MIFYLAALQSTVPRISRSGRDQGASRWYYFFRRSRCRCP